MTKHKMEMQIIYDGRKEQVWEFVSQGLNIGKWSTGKHCDGVAVVKNVKIIMCQECGTLPLKGVCHLPTNTQVYFFLGKEVTVLTFRRNKILVRTSNNYFFRYV